MEIGIREFRAHLRQWLSVVRQGEEVIVTERGRPVARLVSAGETTALDRLVAEGIVRLPTAPRRLARTIQRTRARQSVADLVAEQRR